ncbi:sulfurtransferase [Pseudohongiella spirulinae]|uniref:3-mercaptopyruvate sulfurtransferase n=1 Tax=Pseudohongiella spirulinae TaxID=1249552 RepID=A0A0S2KC52_9GAMM|nr:sulfurtransferase [Pseudohongiella spirulinae]ALO45683.1 3-mercaptopyruvate sulfurtransferase [Pseudohongiella spirulinae]
MEKKPQSPLLSVSELKALSGHDGLFVIDARFRLDDPEYGAGAFAEGHIPGAFYLDLNEDLSSEIVPGVTGRHPLPDTALLEARLRELGLRSTDRVVVYDDGPGFFAARAWWLLVWMGHPQVQVLDGGLAAWKRAGGELTQQQSVAAWPGNFVASPDSRMLIGADDIAAQLGQAPWLLIDARSPERFRGEQEPIDPVAGHIPGALCMPCTDNVDDGGHFLSPDKLRARFARQGDVRDVVSYCGSGVTACHNILAAAVAGLPLPRLYAGSWSEWITDARRPVEVAVAD